MEIYLLRIATINLNENLSLLNEFNILFENDVISNNELNKINGNVKNPLKQYYLAISEELESFKIQIRFNALTKLLFSLINDTNFNFMLHDKLDENFNIKSLEIAYDCGLLNDLIKNLSYFNTKFLEFPK